MGSNLMPQQGLAENVMLKDVLDAQEGVWAPAFTFGSPHPLSLSSTTVPATLLARARRELFLAFAASY